MEQRKPKSNYVVPSVLFIVVLFIYSKSFLYDCSGKIAQLYMAMNWELKFVFWVQCPRFFGPKLGRFSGPRPGCSGGCTAHQTSCWLFGVTALTGCIFSLYLYLYLYRPTLLLLTCIYTSQHHCLRAERCPNKSRVCKFIQNQTWSSSRSTILFDPFLDPFLACVTCTCKLKTI